MARVARMALDVAIVSLRTVQPAISKAWSATKGNDPKSMNHPYVAKIENTVGSFSNLLLDRLRSLRDQLLPIEEQYLLRQLEIVRRKMSNRAAGKSIKPGVALAWQYAKIEVVPPMSIAFFSGPVGRQIENVCGKFADSVIAILQNRAKAMDLAEARAKQAKIDAIKAAEAKAKAKAAEEMKKMEAIEKAKQAKLAEEAKKAEAKKAAEPKAKPAEKPPEKPKPASKPPESKKKEEKPPPKEAPKKK